MLWCSVHYISILLHERDKENERPTKSPTTTKVFWLDETWWSQIRFGCALLFPFCCFSHHPVQHVCKQERSTDAWWLFALIVASCANSNCFNLLVVWQCTTLLSLHLPIHGEHVVWLRCSLLALELLCDTIAVDCWFVMRDVCVYWWWDYFQLCLLKLSVNSFIADISFFLLKPTKWLVPPFFHVVVNWAEFGIGWIWLPMLCFCEFFVWHHCLRFLLSTHFPLRKQVYQEDSCQ